MTERFKLSLSGMWLLASLFSIILPIFLPSFSDAPNLAANPIGAATVAMFILSFPSSLLDIPLLFFINFVLGIDTWSIGAMYDNLLLLFVLGLIQWFWIVPRLLRNESVPQTFVFQDPLELPETRCSASHTDFDVAAGTPIERVINERNDR